MAVNRLPHDRLLANDTLEINPKLAFAYNNWGDALRELHQPAEAIEKYKKALQLDPKYALAYYNWGLALQEQGRSAEAAAKFQYAAELDPTLKRLRRMGALLIPLGNPGSASRAG